MDDAVADDAQPLVPRAPPAAREAGAMRGGDEGADSHGKRQPGRGAADRDGAGERVAVIVRAALDLAPRAPRPGAVWLEAPARVKRPEDDGVAGIDRQHRRPVAREVSVQRAFIRLERVDHPGPGPYPARVRALSLCGC